MCPGTEEAVRLQRDFYARTASRYEDMHERGAHEHALRHVAIHLEAIGARSVLDTGCGTGMAMSYLEQAIPGIEIRGNDPSAELLGVATERRGIDAARLDCVGSEELPYPDGHFDAVVETGVLHHVPDPGRVVGEMLRVARLAVFLSDSNIYGQAGSPLPVRVLKLALKRAGLLPAVLRMRRGGRDWYQTDEDGVGWSYSVFDSYGLLRRRCAEVLVVPTGHKGALSDLCPLLFAQHCLVAGFKEPPGIPDRR